MVSAKKKAKKAQKMASNTEEEPSCLVTPLEGISDNAPHEGLVNAEPVAQGLCASKSEPEQGSRVLNGEGAPMSEEKKSEGPKPRKAKNKSKSKMKAEEDSQELDELLADIRMMSVEASPKTHIEESKGEGVSKGAACQEGASVGSRKLVEGVEGEGGTSKKAKARRTKKKSAVSRGENEEAQESVAVKAPMSAAAKLAQERLIRIEQEKRRLEEEQARAEELEKTQMEEEKERKRIEEEQRERKRQAKREKREKQKKTGKPITGKEKDRVKKSTIAREALLSQMKNKPPERIPVVGLRENSAENERGVDGKNLDAGGRTDEKKGRKSRVVDDTKKHKKKVEKEDSARRAELNSGDERSSVNGASKKTNLASLQDAASASKLEKLTTKEDQGKSEKERAESERKGTWEDCDDWEADFEQQIIQDSEKRKESLVKKKQLPDKRSIPESNPGLVGEKVSSAEVTESVPLKKPLRLRAPICCVLGHVDTGKTKILDKIRHTSVQSSEAGGITQQIGATFFPAQALVDQCKQVDDSFELTLPGLLIIDTPGHESFNNLRVRGSSLCDIAILVVDIMHGLEPQTRESLQLLRNRNCPFIVALNKIDRIYGWQASSWMPAEKTLQGQSEDANAEFKTRFEEVNLQLKEMGLNGALWWEVKDARKFVSVAPLSALTGEGIPDLLYLICKLTQQRMRNTLTQRDQFQCTILEIKELDGLGTTIDVILVAGTLCEGDKLVACGMFGPIVTQVRALLTPQPLKESRVKGEYIHHKMISASMGVKIVANGLEEAVAGTSLLVCENPAELENLKEEVMKDMDSIFKNVDRSGVGVYVMASTLGSLEALLNFFETSKIPVFAINLGTVHKSDVKRASVMREKGRPDLCCILAFDCKVEPEAKKEAQSLKVEIFTADIIYHLFDSFNAYRAQLTEQRKKEKEGQAIFPCILSIIPDCIFNSKNPIVLGVKVDEGMLRIGTPLCVPEKENLVIGRIQGIEVRNKALERAKKGEEVSIKITGDSSVLVGRHFDASHKIYSRLTRESIDCLKEFFQSEISKEDWVTVIKIKKVLSIP